MSNTKKILIDELIEDSHTEKVENVIFWALQDYAKNKKGFNSGAVAYAIKERMVECEKEAEPIIMNPELIESLNL